MGLNTCHIKKHWTLEITEAHRTEVIVMIAEAATFLEKYVSWINVKIWSTQLLTSKLTINICIILHYLPRINSKKYPLFLLNMHSFPFCWKQGSHLSSRIPFSIISLRHSFQYDLNFCSKVRHKIQALLIKSQCLFTSNGCYICD